MAVQDAFSLFRGEGQGAVTGGGTLREIPLSMLSAHPDNRSMHPDVVRRLADEIASDGLGQPILVRHVRGGYQIVSGHHRAEAYRLLLARTGDGRWSSIPAYVRPDLDDEAAKRLMVATNLLTAEMGAEERAEQYRYLYAEAQKARERDAEAFAGQRTSDLVAKAMEAATGRKVSGRTVERRRRAAEQEAAREAGEGRAIPEWEDVFAKRTSARAAFKAGIASLPEEEQRDVLRGYEEHGRSLGWAAREVQLLKGEADKVADAAAADAAAALGRLAQVERHDQQAYRTALGRVAEALRHVEEL